MFVDFLGFSWMFMDFHGIVSVFIDVLIFSLILFDFR